MVTLSQETSNVIMDEPVPLNEIFIPQQLWMRARDCRDVPIPGTVGVIDVNPLMTVHVPMSFINYDYIDWNAWAKCAVDNLCGYCRHPNGYYIFFVGHQTEVYTQTFMNVGMHHECLHYFMQVYPTVYLPRMRSGPIHEGGELPIRLGIYKTRDYKTLKKPQYGGMKNKPNYVIKAGTRVGNTMWVEYDRDMMKSFHDREIEIQHLFKYYEELGVSPPQREIFKVYMEEGKGVN